MTKTISLSDEASGVLRRHKLASGTFSDTVLRLARRGAKLSEVIGLHPELAGRTGLARGSREPPPARREGALRVMYLDTTFLIDVVEHPRMRRRLRKTFLLEAFGQGA